MRLKGRHDPTIGEISALSSINASINTFDSHAELSGTHARRKILRRLFIRMHILLLRHSSWSYLLPIMEMPFCSCCIQVIVQLMQQHTLISKAFIFLGFQRVWRLLSLLRNNPCGHSFDDDAKVRCENLPNHWVCITISCATKNESVADVWGKWLLQTSIRRNLMNLWETFAV